MHHAADRGRRIRRTRGRAEPPRATDASTASARGTKPTWRSAAPAPPRAARRRRCSPKSSDTASSSGIGGLVGPTCHNDPHLGGRPRREQTGDAVRVGAGRNAAFLIEPVDDQNQPPACGTASARAPSSSSNSATTAPGSTTPATPRPGHRTREPHPMHDRQRPKVGEQMAAQECGT